MKKTISFLAFCLLTNVFTLFVGCTTENQKGMSLSPSPPSQALSTSLPPQQAPLPPTPNKQELNKDIFRVRMGYSSFIE